jgi:hypothetical protein
MAVHKGPANLRPRCTQSGSSAAAIPVYSLPCAHHETIWGAEIHNATDTETSVSDWSAARLGRFTSVERDPTEWANV